MKTEKEILEAVRVLQEANPHDEGIQNWVRNYFPELKESDDERIRKRLIAMCKHYIECYALDPYNIDYALDPYNIDDYKEALAWLEKQGDQNLPTEKLPSEMKTVSESLGFTTQKECDDYNKMVTDLIMSDDGKGEQKPANKVEPKFKVGDWVVLSTSDGEKVVQIDSIEYFKSGEPRYITSEGKWFGNGTEAHLWTVQDAKDGDVLYDGHKACIFRQKRLAIIKKH